jgi:hypothetical protein
MTTKKKKKTVPVDYLIEVNVDRRGNFTYTANGQKGASKFQPHLGDTISWVAKLKKRKTDFQVEFPGIAPFAGGVRAFRSAGRPTSPQTVALLPHYRGNLIFKYTVTVSNGWYDDPVIGPVPADGLLEGMNAQTILLSADNNGNLTIAAPPMPLPEGPVAWQWDPHSAYTDDFVLTFKAPGVPAGWPPVTNSQDQTIVLNLQTPGNDQYTINTVNTGLSAGSTLQIS